MILFIHQQFQYNTNFMKAIELLKKIEDELRLRNYSKKTIKSYLICLSDYFHYIKIVKKDPDMNIIKKYLLEKQNKGQSGQTINLYLNAIKYFHREIFKSPVKINLKFAKTSKKLPVVLSRSEIEKIINSIKNRKHKLLISLAYGAGLRVSEAVNLKVKDISVEDLIIHIKQAKGKRDRITVIPERLKPEIASFIAGKNNNDYLIISDRGGKLTDRTAQKIFENALKKSGIKKRSDISFSATQFCHTFIGKWR